MNKIFDRLVLILRKPGVLNIFQEVCKFYNMRFRLLYLCLLLLFHSCADVTSSGKNVHFIESEKDLLDYQETADYLTAKYGCSFIGIADAKASVFPPSYSTHENEIHAALRNRAAKMGGNLVISNFYKKPPQGVVMDCPENYFERRI